MTDYYSAFHMSPVPDPGPDATAPEPYRGIYAMPAFVTIPTTDLSASTDFWVGAFGFIDLYSFPDTLVHLRRWAFQDLLLRPADTVPAEPSTSSITFSCVLNQIDGIVESSRALGAEAVSGPYDTPWNTRDVEVVTPENVRVVFSAAKVFDESSREAQNLADVGITSLHNE